MGNWVSGLNLPNGLPQVEENDGIAPTPDRNIEGVNENQTPVDVCPICWLPVTEACRTPCNHIYCTSCFIRMLAAGSIPSRGSCPMCRQAVSLFSVVSVASSTPLQVPRYHGIAGSTYVQQGGTGVASYHFDACSPEIAYISYTAAPPGWNLDDGTRPPHQKYFEEAVYNESTRTFCGVIMWPPPKTFDKAAKWEYTFTFSDNFSFITDGKLRVFDSANRQLPMLRYPLDLAYWRLTELPRSPSGCVFVQGRKLGLASYHFSAENPSSAYISYSAAPGEWILDSGEMPPMRKSFENSSYISETRMFKGTIHWPVTFRGDSRWEYEMRFSENFDDIIGGMVRAFVPNGDISNVFRFGQELNYVRYVEERAELEATLQDKWNNSL